MIVSYLLIHKEKMLKMLRIFMFKMKQIFNGENEYLGERYDMVHDHMQDILSQVQGAVSVDETIPDSDKNNVQKAEQYTLPGKCQKLSKMYCT